MSMYPYMAVGMTKSEKIKAFRRSVEPGPPKRPTARVAANMRSRRITAARAAVL